MKTKVQTVRDGLRVFNRWAGVLKSDPYGLGLSLSQSGALVDLERFGNLRPAELAARLKLDRSSVSRLIQSLEEKKLVVTAASQDDGRSKLVSITHAGKRALTQIHKISNESVAAAFRHLSVREQNEITAAFEKLSLAVELAEGDH